MGDGMITSFDRTLETLGDGEVIATGSGKTIFRLASCEKNPVVKPQDIGLTWKEAGKTRIGAVFNAGVELFEEKVILAPRCHQGYKKGTFFDEALGMKRHCLENYISEVWPLVSEDGLHFARFKNVVISGDGTAHKDFTYGIEDIRIVKYGGRYVLVGCGKTKPPFKGGDSDRITIYSTDDFVNITYHGMVRSFDSRNAVPFTDPTDDRHYILLRFHPNIHLDILEAGMDQLLDPPRHAYEWEEIHKRKNKNLLLEAGHYLHEKEKIGPGPQVIKTDKGWLVIYHAVGEIEDSICKAYGLKEKIERGYSVCAALLDLRDPRNVLCRTRDPIYIPVAPYELCGDDEYPVDVPAVVFPVGVLVRKGKLLLYAGAGDKYITLLSCNLGGLIDYLWEYCRLNCR
ncbi:hypothetical protein E3J38_08900 [candidate division TA06 bacterium]|uniref:Glycosidase n=1 Tax=candidate division TA06 bacterium TaxID=2250710 RepID=A0A523XG29_UNCT6|nr:MAG: hypothetical protein E3J38_08900 [candidate division TA06 bacterium]